MQGLLQESQNMLVILSSKGLNAKKVESCRIFFTRAGGTGLMLQTDLPGEGAATTAKMRAVAHGTVIGAVEFKNTIISAVTQPHKASAWDLED